MKTLIITGPSGSGKSYLTKNISKLFNNTIVIKTDSYYKDNILAFGDLLHKVHPLAGQGFNMSIGI